MVGQKQHKDMKTIVISLARKSAHRDAAIAYVAHTYFERFGTIPLESLHYLTAYVDSTIVGAIGLDFKDANEMLPLEAIYIIDRTSIPFPVTSSNSAQFGRWSAKASNISMPLLYAASMYAVKNNRLYGWLNHTESIHRILTRKGIVFTRIDARLVLENVRAEDRLFYTNNCDVQCYIMELYQVVYALKQKMLENSLETIIFKDF
jgi:hypothetical protein